MKKILFAIMVLLAVFTVSCTTEDTTTGNIVAEDVVFDDNLFSEENNTMTDSGNSDIFDEMDNVTGENMSEDQIEGLDTADVTMEVTEGDLVELRPSAEDPDGDKIVFTFSEPLNQNGRWQTNEGDAGKYLATVTADDGNRQTSQDVLIVVKPANKAPTIECPETLIVNEGEEMFIDCNIYDIDGSDSDIIVTYSGWLKQPAYTTTYDDAGEHTVVVSAEDAFGKESLADVKVTVRNVNRAPVFIKEPEDIIAMEGDLITLDYEATDSDGDEFDTTFSEPFNSKGTWQTEIGDAGTYNSFVAVSDGEFTAKKEFSVVVQLVNTAPVIKQIPDIYVNEGDTVEINVDATDREGDRLTITYDGWMDSAERVTTYDDARPDGCSESECTAEYTVTVTVSDGFLEASQDVHIFVKDVDRPPVFKGILG